MKSAPRPGLLLAIPLALAVLVFARAIGFPFVNWDDPSHFLDNPLAVHPLARGLRGLFLTREIAYPAPVLLLSFALDRAVWGVAPGPYHAENLLLHLANVALLFQLARRMRLSDVEACAVATLFAVHPLVVEPVCWVTGRKDLLSTALVFGAALVAAGNDGARSDVPSAPWRWVVANVAMIVAVLVLPRAVVGPILVVVFVHAIRPGWSLSRVAARMAPALPVALAVVAVGARQIASLGALPPPRSPSGVIADVAGAWALQLSHVVFPVDLLSYYFREPGDPPLSAMVLAALVAGALLAFVALRTSRESPTRAGTALLVVSYAPVSCLFVIRRWTADSYMYMPLAALALALVPAIARAWPQRLASFGRYAWPALSILLAFLSFAGTSRWSSSAAVWAGSIARYPDEPLSYEHEGLGLVADGRTAEAGPLFIRMAERFPDWKDTVDDEVRAYANAGDPHRAAESLARGVRLGNSACLRMYWMSLIASPTLPEPSERELVAAAFRNGFGEMKDGLHDPAAFRRVVAILRAEGLDGPAAEVAEHLAELERARGDRQ